MSGSGVEVGGGTPLGGGVRIDDVRIQAHLDEVVRSTVEEALNALLDAEAEHLCGARKYELTEGRKDTRAGSYTRQLHTKAGEVSLQVPKLRRLPFETAIIERYRRRESSVEEALIEMYLAGVSVRRARTSPRHFGVRNQCVDGERYEPEDLRQDRRVAPAAAGGRVSVRFPRWPVVEEELGRRGEERVRAGGDRRVADRLSRGSRGQRRREGRQGELDQPPARDEAARLERRAAVRLRQMPGADREPGGFLSGGEVAALRGPLLSERVDGGTHRQGEGSSGDAGRSTPRKTAKPRRKRPTMS
jgi:hypothetical protein